MKRGFILPIVFGMLFTLSACGSSSAQSNSDSAKNANVSTKQEKQYKYFFDKNIIHTPKGTVTLNKMISGKKDNQFVAFLDETVTNSTSKEINISDIDSLSIIAYQKSEDGSQKIQLDDQVTPSDLFDIVADSNQTDNYNLANDIVDRQNNKLLPHKSVHLLREFGYTLNNDKNDIELQLVDQQNDDTVNPKKSVYDIKINEVLNNKLNLSEY